MTKTGRLTKTESSAYVATLLLGVMCLWILTGCIENPFSESDIIYRSRQIRGQVLLSDRASPEGVYVWLEGFNIGTRTDETGQFQVTLPPPGSQGASSGIGGVFKLYFYVANYALSSAEAVVQNGEFLYSRGDIKKNGELNGTKSLLKLLNISTVAEPASVTTDFEGQVNVELTLQATLDSVTVVFPKITEGLSGALLLSRVGWGNIVMGPPETSANTLIADRIGTERRSWLMVFNLDRGTLPAGQYEIVPYFLIEQENLPAGLLASLGANVEELSTDYLQIPFKREGGHFKVRGIIW